jgi:hypothetical protein
MYLNEYMAGLIHEQGKIHDSKRRSKGVKGAKEDYEVDNTNTYLLGNQIISSCKELNDFMAQTAVKQQLLMKLTGIDL